MVESGNRSRASRRRRLESSGDRRPAPRPTGGTVVPLRRPSTSPTRPSGPSRSPQRPAPESRSSASTLAPRRRSRSWLGQLLAPPAPRSTVGRPGPRPGSADRSAERLPQRRSTNPPPPRPPQRPASLPTRGRSPQPGPMVRRRKRTNPVVLYLVRLLILVIGLGAIVGTLLSIFSPTLPTDAQASSSESAADISPGDRLGESNLLSSLVPIALNRPLGDLADEVNALATPYTDLTPGIFMLDYETGNYLDINGRQVMSAASIIKVPILVAFFEDIDNNKIRYDEIITLTEADVAEGSGDMQFHGIGSEYSALETASMMIVISDNSATNMLIRRLGGAEALNERFRAWGLNNTVIRDWLPDLQGTNTTTPYEMVELMTRISQGEIISLRSRDRLFDIMRRTYTDTLIPAGVNDPEATIAHKTGDIGSMVGDVGTVDTPQGKRYGIAVMMNRPHNDNRAQDLIRQINATIYSYLTRPPQLPRNQTSQTEPTPEGQALPSDRNNQISTERTP